MLFTEEESHTKHICSGKPETNSVLEKPLNLSYENLKSVETGICITTSETKNEFVVKDEVFLEDNQEDMAAFPPLKEGEKITPDTTECENEATFSEGIVENKKQLVIELKSILVYVCSKCNFAFEKINLYEEHPCAKEKLKKKESGESILSGEQRNPVDEGKLLYQCTRCHSVFDNFSAFKEHPCLLQKDNLLVSSIVGSDPENITEGIFKNFGSVKNDPNRPNNVEVNNSKGDTQDLSELVSIKLKETNSPSTSKTSPPKKLKGEKTKSTTPWQCSVCHKVFKVRYYLIHHSCEPPSKNRLPYGALGKPPYVCPKCGKSYKHKQSFCRHIHHECKMVERPQKIIPPIRPRKSSDLPNTPHSFKPYQCPVCAKCFAKKYYLIHHSCDPPANNPLPRGALGKPPFLCSGCGVMYKHKPSYCRHIHHECGKGRMFHKSSKSNQSDTKVDRKRKAKEKASQTYVCGVCNTECRDQDDLEVHVQVDHLSL